MENHDFGGALRFARSARSLSQEDFSGSTTQAHLSRLEGGRKEPTLAKIEELSDRLEIHPLTLLSLAYARVGGHPSLKDLLRRVEAELQSLGAGPVP